MADIFGTVFDFLQTTAIVFDWSGNSYSFTFWQVALSLLVFELGIYIIGRIVKG